MTAYYRKPGRTAGTYYLPGETEDEVLADFVTWYEALRFGGRGGSDHGKMTGQQMRLSAQVVMRHLMGMDGGHGADLLAVGAEQADECRECIGGKREKDDLGRTVRELCYRKA